MNAFDKIYHAILIEKLGKTIKKIINLEKQLRNCLNLIFANCQYKKVCDSDEIQIKEH